jgi:hypothetical protein
MRSSVDEKLAAVLHDVLVPEGLAQRLLDRLESNVPMAGVVAPSAAPRRTSRRVWAFAAGLTALAAGLFFAAWLGLQQGDDISPQYVLDEAIRSFSADMDEPGPLLATTPAPTAYPQSAAVFQVRGTRWRHLESFVGRRGVVYDLPGPAAGVGASLYVMDAQGIDGLDAIPSLNPYTTAGCCASVWLEGGLLYVFVVQGDTDAYRSYLNLPHGPMA